jgi:hypothetical protein
LREEAAAVAAPTEAVEAVSEPDSEAAEAEDPTEKISAGTIFFM